jgi:hypothetical protein
VIAITSPPEVQRHPNVYILGVMSNTMLFGKLHPLSFIMSLGVGLLFVYVFAPRPRRVCKFPNAINTGHVVYKKFGTQDCYIYNAETVKCDKTAKAPPTDSEQSTCNDEVIASV